MPLVWLYSPKLCYAMSRLCIIYAHVSVSHATGSESVMCYVRFIRLPVAITSDLTWFQTRLQIYTIYVPLHG
ncbi:hypothetical protein BDW71DRAFT_162704 [Aspergillus fruticulosus]